MNVISHPRQRQLMLIPGFMCDTSLWDSVRAGLEELGQTHFAGLNQDDSIEAMAEHLLPNLPSACVLIGFSLGGYVARHLAWLAQDRIAGLVLLNTSARASTELELARNQQQIKMLATYPYKGQTVRALQHALHPQRQDNPVLLTHLQAMSLALGKEVFIRQLAIKRQDGHHELADIACPALVVASRNDQMRSLDESEKLVAALPDAELHIIEDCGHMSPLEKPAELIQVLQCWLHKTGL
ncbi:alpha/beta fold hydrolase [Undibacterium sp. TJN19]|uniref:alpha/beta fold hydrolase n=1 Tax=Undibacterium sp. TJN19 TaxID=3413055 RepID=UPI003BF36FB5